MMNGIRFSGLASGIDTEELIGQMMQVEKIKVDRVEQDKQISSWRQEAFNTLNKDFANFILNTRKSFGLNSITNKGTFRKNSYQNLDWVKGASSSNDSIGTATSTSKAMDGNYDVEVEQLAKGVTLSSGVDIRGEKVDGKWDGGLVDADGKLNIESDMEFTIHDGNHEFTIDIKKGSSMNDVVSAINKATEKVGNKDVSIGVRASYDKNQGRFFLQTTATGEESQIKIGTTDEGTEAAKDFIDRLNLTTGEKEIKEDGSIDTDEDGKPKYVEYKANDKAITGQDAIIHFNGATNITSSSNNVTVNGVSMALKAKGEFTVTVSTDVDAVYDKISDFVDEYNKLVDRADKLVGEKQNRDYKPLSAEEKKAMTKEDVELWEEKAKSGLLSRDSTIEQTMLRTRQSLYEVGDFNGSFSMMTQIGISTEKYAKGAAGGKLTIDEDKLRDAIANDVESVMELMFKESERDKDDNVTNLGGIVTRVHENLMDGMESIIRKSGSGGESSLYTDVRFDMLRDFRTTQGGQSSIDKEVAAFNKKIDQLNIMLAKKEQSHYARFAAMEKAMSKLNQQGDWLQQQMMG